MTSSNPALAAAEWMTSAMTAMDAERFTSIYADDARVWHSVSRTEQSKAENTAFLTATMQQFTSMEYRDIRRTLTERGIVQQHVLLAVMKDGTSIEVPACLVIAMRGDKISRIDEYFNPPA